MSTTNAARNEFFFFKFVAVDRLIHELLWCLCFRDEDAPAKIEDPDAVKPEGWLDDELEFVADPNAEKPEDW